MKRAITIIMLSLATTVQAGETKIVETETGVVAEITGLPSSGSSDSAVPAAAVSNENATRVRSLTTQVEQLKKERADILKLTGNETEDELTQKNALADEKKLQIDAYSAEISQLTGNDQNTSSGTDQSKVDQPKAEQPVPYQSYRQDKKNQIRELKKMRMNPPADSAPQ